MASIYKQSRNNLIYIMHKQTSKSREIYIDDKGTKKSRGYSWRQVHNLADKYYTTGQILIDYQFMLDKTIAELKKQITDRPIIVMDPCAGRKALVKEYENVIWKIYDLEPETEDTIQADFLDLQINYKPDLIVCNPPFKLKKEFAKKCMQLADNVIFISPPNAIPYYEYSLKVAYCLDFRIQTLVGLWHYNKLKNNKEKFIGKYNYRVALESREVRATYEEYMSMPDRDRYLVIMGAYFFADTRHVDAIKRSPLTVPSLIDFFETKEDLEVLAPDGIYSTFDPTNEEYWKAKMTNGLIKKGDSRRAYLIKMKDGIKYEDIVKFYEDNKAEIYRRSIFHSPLHAPNKTLPLTEEEAQLFFADPPIKKKQTK